MNRVALFMAIAIVLGAAQNAIGQPATYHLHIEPSTTAGLAQLKTIDPDVAATSIQSIDLRISRRPKSPSKPLIATPASRA